MGDNENILELFAEDPELLDDRKPKLFRLSYSGHRFVYRYDFGDDWHHDIHVEDVVRPTINPVARRGSLQGHVHARRKM